jgi:SH3 domain protein
MSQPSAREQLQQVKQKNQSLLDQQVEFKQQIAALKKKENELAQVKSTLAQLRESAAEPIRVAEENMQLKQELADARATSESLRSENAFLADDSLKHWFLIGAAVSIGSLLLGLLITRINWKKKNSWAGTF